MPENDVLRFFLIIIITLVVFTLLFRAIDNWTEAIKEKRRNERIRLQLDIAEKTGQLPEWKNEALNDMEDGSPDN